MGAVFITVVVVSIVMLAPHVPLWVILLYGGTQGMMAAFAVAGWWQWRRRRNERTLERLADLRRGQYAGGK